MSFVVIAYPKISQKDFRWIQAIRKINDRRMFHVVKPHVTFIFPTTKLDAVKLARHVTEHVGDFKAIKIKLDSAKVVQDHNKKYSHTFLIPSIGYDAITKLHDLLYVNDMASELREDIPFVPHVGIGMSGDHSAMEMLAKDIDESDINIYGLIDHLVIAGYDGNKVTDITEISLGRLQQ